MEQMAVGFPEMGNTRTNSFGDGENRFNCCRQEQKSVGYAFWNSTDIQTKNKGLGNSEVITKNK